MRADEDDEDDQVGQSGLSEGDEKWLEGNGEMRSDLVVLLTLQTRKPIAISSCQSNRRHASLPVS